MISASEQFISIPSDDFSQLVEAQAHCSEVLRMIGSLSADEFVERRQLSLACVLLAKDVVSKIHTISRSTQSALPEFPWKSAFAMAWDIPKKGRVDTNAWYLIIVKYFPPLEADLAVLVPRLQARAEAEKIDADHGDKANVTNVFSSRRRGDNHGRFMSDSGSKLRFGTEPGYSVLKTQVEMWYDSFVKKHGVRGNVLERLKGDECQHSSAFFELFFHEYFRRLAINCEYERDVGNNHPDFIVHHQHGDFILEVTTSWTQPDLPQQRKMILKVLNLFDSICSDYLFSVTFLTYPVLTDIEPLKEEIIAWLNEIRPAPNAVRHFDPDVTGFDGYVVALQSNGMATDGAVFEWYLPQPSRSDTALMCERPFNREYGYIEHWNKPIVSAVGTRENAILDEISLYHTLFGAVQIASGPHCERSVQILSKGRRFRHDQNTRISAILLCCRRWDRSKMVYDIKVIHNPWARAPLSTEVFFQHPQLIPDAEHQMRLQWSMVDAAPFELPRDTFFLS